MNLKQFHDLTPLTDKVLAVIGSFSAVISLSDVSSVVGIVVGLVTISMIFPRAVLNWIELAKDRAQARRAAKLLAEAERESSDY